MLRQIRKKALDAVQMVVEKDKTVRSWLADLLHPAPGSEDNDLEVFQGDLEFERLLGEPGS